MCGRTRSGRGRKRVRWRSKGSCNQKWLSATRRDATRRTVEETAAPADRMPPETAVEAVRTTRSVWVPPPISCPQHSAAQGKAHHRIDEGEGEHPRLGAEEVRLRRCVLLASIVRWSAHAVVTADPTLLAVRPRLARVQRAHLWIRSPLTLARGVCRKKLVVPI